MTDTVWSACGKRVNRLLDAKVALLNQITNNEVARPVKPVVAVYSNKILVRPAGFGLGTQFLILPDLVDYLNEALNFLICGWDLGNCRELMVLDAVSEASWIVDGIVMADVYNVFDNVAPSMRVSMTILLSQT